MFNGYYLLDEPARDATQQCSGYFQRQAQINFRSWAMLRAAYARALLDMFPRGVLFRWDFGLAPWREAGSASLRTASRSRRRRPAPAGSPPAPTAPASSSYPAGPGACRRSPARSGYHRHSLMETAILRLKTILTDKPVERSREATNRGSAQVCGIEPDDRVGNAAELRNVSVMLTRKKHARQSDLCNNAWVAVDIIYFDFHIHLAVTLTHLFERCDK